jgi:glutaredoxin
MGVSYIDKNVGIDRAAGQEMVMKSGQMGVPVIDINGTIIVGFQPEVFEKLINQ